MIKKQFQYAIDWLCQLKAHVNGDTYESIEWVDDILYTEQQLVDEYENRKREHILWKEMILKRNDLLQQSDWTQNRDVFLQNDEAWKVYRQSLRDITDNVDPIIDEVIWPTKPE